MRTVSVRLADLAKTELYVGYVGENLHTRVVIDASKMFEQYPTAAVAMTVQPPFSEAYPAVVERQGNDVIWDVTDSDLIRQGNGEIQLAFTVGEIVAKTFVGRIRIGRSIIPTGDIPDPLDDFLTRAGAALTAIPETIDEALADAKASGEFDGPPGDDGFSPVANVTKSGKTATITITDKAGTTTAQVTDGADGTDIIDDTAGAGDTDKTWSADKVVSELGDVRDLVAYPYEDLTFPVAKNALCVHDGKLYKSTQAIQTEEAWTPSHWYDVTGGKAVTGLYTGLDNIAALANTKYTKPAGGIPASDLAAGVIPDVSGKADKADTVLDTTLSHGRANNNPVGNDSVAYGSYVIASGAQSQAFGSGSTASGAQAHAEGAGTTASGNYSHSEGGGTTASANQAHAEGAGTTASGESAHSENGATVASGKNAHAEGTNTIANHKSQHAGGEWNVADPSSAAATERGTYAEIIGNGTSANARSNARTLDWSGNEELAGDLTVKKGTADEVSISTLKIALSAKQDAPASGASAGKVLGLALVDGQLVPVWDGFPVSDVQVNGTSVLSQGIANVPLATNSTFGVGKFNGGDYGVSILDGSVYINKALDSQMKAGTGSYRPVCPVDQHKSAFYGLAKAAGDSTQASSSNPVGTFTDAAKSAISTMLNGAVSVSGTTPSITGQSGLRYVCGEVATLTITVPASGIIDVSFDSGSTPTVLTVTPPTGMTMRWIGDDPTALEANKHYEINIADGCNGMVVSWT